MILKLKEKELSFRWLQECDIDVIEEQIKNYEKENGEFSLETFYKIYSYTDVTYLGGEEYDVDVHVIFEDDWESSIFISLNLDGITDEIADQYQIELDKYLQFRFIELALNNI